MKSDNAESQKQLPVEPESAEIFDFLYVDRSRISALYAQLFPQGILTNVKTTSQQSFSDTSNIGSDIKVLKAESISANAGMEGIEHSFDTSWSIPVEVLARLQELSLIQSSLENAALGSIILAPACYLRIIDYGSMKDLWEPIGHILSEIQPNIQNFQAMMAMVRGLPHAIHAHFLTNFGYLWSSLQPSNLNIPVNDLILKHGGTIAGAWKLLFVLDAYPDIASPPDFESWSAGEMTNGILGAMHGIWTAMGRPSGWLGITPLMIYRNMTGGIIPEKTSDVQ